MPGTAQAIVGGTQVSSNTKFPFQVELWNQLGGDPADGFFCGGVILDSLHIATAAHCVFDESTDQVTPPGQLHVLAGTTDLKAGGTDTIAAATSFDPRYNPNTSDYDMGVITLSQALATGDQLPTGSNTIAKVPLIALDDTTLTANGKPVTVSGWGYPFALTPNEAPDPSKYPTKLNSVQVKIAETGLPPDSGTCASHYLTVSLTETPRMLCAADSGKDSCFGDSGGPLVSGTAANNYQLAGLVESGAGCAQSFYPGIYDRVANLDVRTFLTSNPPQAPQQQSSTALVGTPAAGQTITCDPGQWSGNPTFQYEFFRDATGQGAFLVQGPSAQNTYTVQSSDVGTQLLCLTKASAAGGYGIGASALVTGAAPVITTPPATVVDTARPTLGIARKSCSNRGRCVVNMVVADPMPSSGIAKVDAKLRWRTVVACKSAKKRCTRMKTKTLKAQSIGGDHYLVIVSHLKTGNYTLILTAVDKAGNKQQKSTYTTLRVKLARKR
jgi:secreted trypsin-like serine protease